MIRSIYEQIDSLQCKCRYRYKYECISFVRACFLINLASFPRSISTGLSAWRGVQPRADTPVALARRALYHLEYKQFKRENQIRDNYPHQKSLVQFAFKYNANMIWRRNSNNWGIFENTARRVFWSALTLVWSAGGDGGECWGGKHSFVCTVHFAIKRSTSPFSATGRQTFDFRVWLQNFRSYELQEMLAFLCDVAVLWKWRTAFNLFRHVWSEILISLNVISNAVWNTVTGLNNV